MLDIFQMSMARARGEKTGFQNLLTRYGLERFPPCPGFSDERERFILKRRRLFGIRHRDPVRPARNLGLPGHGSPVSVMASASIRSFCSVDISDDGAVFDLAGIHTAPMGGEEEWPSARGKDCFT